MNIDAQLEGWAFVEALYESSVENCGNPLELRLFDPQLSEYLNEEWLSQATEKVGITPAEIRSMVGDGLLRKWQVHNGHKNSRFTVKSKPR